MANNQKTANQKEDADFLQLLRSKTEENDLKQVLKSTMGGYTKQSVSEYLAFIRKNQQTMAETFYENQQLLYVEKEKLRQDYEKLQKKYNDLDAKFLDLSATIHMPTELIVKAHKEEVQELNSIIEALKNSITVSNDKINELSNQNSNLVDEMLVRNTTTHNFEETQPQGVDLQAQIESLEMELQEGVLYLESLSAENADLKVKLELATQEADTRKSLLVSNDTEAEQNRARTNELAEMLETQSQILQNERVKWESEKAAFENDKHRLEEQLVLLKHSSADGTMAQRSTQDLDLMMKVNELTEQLALQTDLVASENTERTIREETIRSLSAQIEALKADTATFKTHIENLTLQNEKLLLANTTMSTRMEEECRRTTALINEKSDVTIEKLMAMKKLSDAETKISVLEMELSRVKFEQR